jgi:hypothetical protein
MADRRAHDQARSLRLDGARTRLASHRVIYEIDDDAATVTVLRVDHRSDVYRRHRVLGPKEFEGRRRNSDARSNRSTWLEPRFFVKSRGSSLVTPGRRTRRAVEFCSRTTAIGLGRAPHHLTLVILEGGSPSSHVLDRRGGGRGRTMRTNGPRPRRPRVKLPAGDTSVPLS